jgi:hypothetical protein
MLRNSFDKNYIDEIKAKEILQEKPTAEVGARQQVTKINLVLNKN